MSWAVWLVAGVITIAIVAFITNPVHYYNRIRVLSKRIEEA